MNYEVLNYNDNGTARVRMTIGDNVLEQDFSVDNLDDNVKLGLAVFQAELENNKPTLVDNSIIGVVTEVKAVDLPVIQEQPSVLPASS